MLKQLIKQGLEWADDLCVAAAPARSPPSDSFVTVLLHSLREQRCRLRDDTLAPDAQVTVSDFREFVEIMLEDGYTVVSAADVDQGLKPGGKYLAITFDDGYFNNTLALQVLAEFCVPATFFVSVGHVLENKAFWWDACSRALSRTGASETARKVEIARLKCGTPDQIEAHLRDRFGSRVLEPCDDRDRPFTPGELAQFARNPWVQLGNHTRDHAILTRCTLQEIAHQVGSCQDILAELAGYRPIAIAYPNGDFSPAAIDAATAAGLRLGFTVVPRRSRLTHDATSRMTLGRYLLQGGQDMRRLSRKFGARFVPSHMVKALVHSA